MTAATPLPEPAVLSCSNLSFKHGSTLLLRDISLAVRNEETLGIVGPNGSGKSTLLKLLCGLRKPDSGTVCLGEKALQNWPLWHRARELAMVEQQADTEDVISVFDVVALGRTPWLSALSPWSAQEDAIVRQALHDVGAAHLSTRRWHSLSGGERQRVHIAKALAQRPNILLLDEPGNHLDIQHQLAILELVHKLPVTTLVALHDLNHALLCDRLAVLDQGRLIALGPPLDVLTPQLLLNTFGVHVHYLTDPFDGATQLRFKQNTR